MSSQLKDVKDIKDTFFSFLQKSSPSELDRKQLDSWEKSKRLDFARTIIELFGMKIAASIQQQRKPNDPLYSDLYYASMSACEIQNDLREKPKLELRSRSVTEKLKDRYPSLDPNDIFKELLETSYGILPFPQQVIAYDNYDSNIADALEKIEKTREDAFRILADVLNGKQKNVKPSDQYKVAKLLWSQNALSDKTYGEVVDEWAKLSSENQLKKKSLLEDLHVSQWATTNKSKEKEKAPQWTSANKEIEEKEVEADMGSQFSSNLIDETIHDIERHFKKWILKNTPEHSSVFQFSPYVIERLKDLTRSETSRSHIACFATNLDFLAETEHLERSRSKVKTLLYAIKTFLNLILKYRVNSDKLEELLEILLRSLDVNYLALLKNMQPTERDKEDPEFTKTWDHFKVLTRLCAGTPSSSFRGSIYSLPSTPSSSSRKWSFFSSPSSRASRSITHPSPKSSPNREEELHHRENRNSVALLFFFLLKNPKSELYVQLFQKLGARQEFRLSPQLIYAFCEKNPSLDEKHLSLLVQTTNSILKELEQRKIHYPRAERFFLDPPLVLETGEKILQEALGRIQYFFKFIPEELPWTDVMLKLLRKVIYHSNLKGLDLLLDFKDLKLDENCIAEVLALPAYPDPALKKEKIKAKQMVQSLSQKYGFTPAQQLSLYVEFIQQIVANQEEEIRSTSKFIVTLRDFCPGLNSFIAHSLFRYHPKVSLNLFDSLVKMKSKYNRSERNGFILDQDEYKLIMAKVEEFCDAIKINSYEHEKQLQLKIKFILEAAFFPPDQCLSDFFRITGLSMTHGIHWSQPYLETHEGQFHSVFSHSNLRVFLHWQLVAGYPVLFISFSDDESALSSFIRLDHHFGEEMGGPRRQLVADEIQKSNSFSNNIQAEFFGYLCHLGLYIFREKATEEKIDDINIPKEESRHRWVHFFSGLNDELKTYKCLDSRIQDKIWDFGHKVKIAYRNQYLAQTLHMQPEYTPSSPLESASLGNIYTKTHARGCLLPEYMADLIHQKDCFIVDINENDVEQIRTLFSKPLEGFSPILLKESKLSISLMTNEETAQAFELHYRVKDASDVLKEDVEEINESREYFNALPLKEVKETLYVTVRIDLETRALEIPMHYPIEILSNPQDFLKRFDRQILFLKSFFYYHNEHAPKLAKQETSASSSRQSFKEIQGPSSSSSSRQSITEIQGPSRRNSDEEEKRQNS